MSASDKYTCPTCGGDIRAVGCNNCYRHLLVGGVPVQALIAANSPEEGKDGE